MNKHSRIIVILLLIVISALTAAIIIFRVNVSHEAANDSPLYEISDTDDTGTAVVYRDGRGSWGLKDSSGTVILEPEWNELTQLGGGCFRAELLSRSGPLYGVINSNGDIIVPFAYDEIKKLSDYIYSARLSGTGRYLFYGRDFSMLFDRPADDYSLEGTGLCIKEGNDAFTYNQGDVMPLIKAELPRYKRPLNLNLSVEDTDVLSVMTTEEWQSFADSAVQFLDAFRRNKPEKAKDIVFPDSYRDVSEIIEEDTGWKGSLSENTSVYRQETDDGTEICFNAELLCERETEALIPEFDENGDQIIMTEMQTEEYTVSLSAAFRKSETGDWLICGASLS